MTTEDIYYAVEILSGLTVIGSLIFVGLQLHQNTRAIRASSAWAYTQLWVDTARDNFISPEWAGVMRRAFSDYEALDGVERFRVNEYFTRGMKQIEFIYQQYLDGNLSQQQWRGMQATLDRLIGMEAFQRYWARRGADYDTRFQDLVKRRHAALAQDSTATPAGAPGRSP